MQDVRLLLTRPSLSAREGHQLDIHHFHTTVIKHERNCPRERRTSVITLPSRLRTKATLYLTCRFRSSFLARSTTCSQISPIISSQLGLDHLASVIGRSPIPCAAVQGMHGLSHGGQERDPQMHGNLNIGGRVLQQRVRKAGNAPWCRAQSQALRAAAQRSGWIPRSKPLGSLQENTDLRGRPPPPPTLCPLLAAACSPACTIVFKLVNWVSFAFAS